MQINCLGQTNLELARSSTEWTLLMSLMRGTMSNSGASKLSLDMLTDMITKENRLPSVTPENFSPILGTLQEYTGFATRLADVKGVQRKLPSSPLYEACCLLPLILTPKTREPPHNKALRAVDLMFELRKYLSIFFKTSGLSNAQGGSLN